MSDPTNNDYDDEDRPPRRRSRDNPFDDFFSNFMNQLGGFKFDQLFDQMDFFLEDLFRRFNVRNLMDDTDSGFPGFVWGFRMTKGPDGRPQVERFGNTPQKVGESSKFRPSTEREPLVDVIEDTDVIRVIAEIPGVTKQDIDLSATENSLLIQAESGKRKYYKELDLPFSVLPDSAAAKFKNGVLEVELAKNTSNTLGKQVPVD
ncbi:MAG: archaeal heat shock protein Hsp20 [Candidatus Hodarchaeales archaeon]